MGVCIVPLDSDLETISMNWFWWDKILGFCINMTDEPKAYVPYSGFWTDQDLGWSPKGLPKEKCRQMAQDVRAALERGELEKYAVWYDKNNWYATEHGMSYKPEITRPVVLKFVELLEGCEGFILE